MIVRSLRGAAFAAVASLVVLGCSKGGSSSGGSLGAASTAPTTTATTTTTPAPVTSTTTPTTTAAVGTHVVASATFRALTYNVAGLPQGISSSSPITNQPIMSPLLNAYDLVIVQEDFAYHNLLSKDAHHPYQTTPLSSYNSLVGDGLDAFSGIPLTLLSRTKWVTCNGWFDQGSDCLSSKGFFFAQITPYPGVTIDLYDLHADAGRSSGDIQARREQFKQLADAISVLSKGHAVILGGDTNLKTDKEPLDEVVLDDFMTATGLKDSARTLGAIEKLDRLMFRNAADGSIELEPKKWRIADEFIDAAGNPLSDHEAINVDFEWRLVK